MKVLFASGIDGDTRRYRCVHHQEQLELAGIESTLREADDPQLYVDVTTHDVFILHRAPYSDLVADLIDIAHIRGKPVIFETDDLIFRPDLYDQIGLLDTLSAQEAHRWRNDLAALQQTLQQSDYALVTTDFLAKMVEDEGIPVYVHRNACSEEMVQVAEVAYQIHLQTRSTDQRVVLGYFSGSGSHNRDFAIIAPILLEVMERCPDVHLHLGGQIDIDPAFSAYATRIQRSPYVSWRELPNIIAQVDINLAPLELDNPLCLAKSEIKYTEAALVGVPTIATPVGAFQYSITHGQNGLMASTSQEWQDAIDTLILNPAQRHQLGEAARQHTYQNYTATTRSKELIALLNQIQEAFEPTATDLKKAPETVAHCMMRRMNQITDVLAQQKEQLMQLRNTLSAREVNRERDDFWREDRERTESLYADDLRHILTRIQRTS